MYAKLKAKELDVPPLVRLTTAKYHRRYSFMFSCHVKECINRRFFAQTPCKLKETIKNDD